MKKEVSPLQQVVNLSKECHTLLIAKKEGDKYIHFLKLSRSNFPTLKGVTDTQDSLDYHLVELKSQIKSRLEPILKSNNLDYDKCFPKGFLSIKDLQNGCLEFPLGDNVTKVLIMSGDKQGEFITISESVELKFDSLIDEFSPLLKR